ncbi:ribonuclease H-like domain-containing protein [Tanacetum coccineum]|uniref:Ribonuclease H-like domain-containing protein n=1 Tax=Tanacetum coccineum TaxID=301880 RepID=A0ABQ4Z227_9ASTR
MDLETTQITTTAKFPTLKQGKYDMWRLRIKQYFQVQDYALWDVIENENSFKPAAKTTTNVDGTSTTLIPGPVTTEEKVQKKNDIKARSMLLMALPNEHLMTFNQYKDAKTFFAAIQTRFGGNEATKENKPELDTMSFDDSTTISKINLVVQEVKGTTSSEAQAQNSLETWLLCHSLALEEMDLKWQLALLSMRTRRFFQKTGRKITINGSDTAGYDKSKVECFNCHKMGHFARECRGPRNQDSRNRNQDSSRRTVNVEETSSKAMVAIDGAGFDWSYMVDDEVPTNMALMAFSDSEVISYEQLVVLKRGISYKDLEISMLKSELEKLKQENESNQLKIENFDNASKSLDKLIGSQIPNKSIKGLGFVSYNDVPPPPTGLFSLPNLDLSNYGLEEFQQHAFEGYGPKTNKNVSENTSNEVRESPDAPNG